MKRSLRFCALAILLLASSSRAEDFSGNIRLLPRTSRGPEVSLVAFDDESEKAACTPSACDSDCCAEPFVGSDFYVCEERCGGFIAGAEIVFLRPYFSEDFQTTATVDLDFEPSQRVWVGYQDAEGLGARLRYWEIDRGETVGATTVAVEYRTFDAEMTQDVDFSRWSLLMSGGLRYAETMNEINAQQSGFDGIGLTFGLEGLRDIGSSGRWQMATSGRWSALYGNSTITTAGGVLVDRDRDDLANVLELRLGPQFRRETANGGYLTFGGGVEAQYWHNGAGVDTQDTGFAGFYANVALTR